ncbi:hypothetical protein FYK55_25910 [Roseiconus nitratireducens]|uniref:Uncharacterized protein n=1 Tax=Roseiconus nitratireducens TaxID=2605748 RepID=A0A5M6CVA6_9BACT|nr:hypothetical protein [Roseiconus nitratireducens]KAA5538876.1 hypothetical protein FYK55_25910 [Roseiconus nitratireducens]
MITKSITYLLCLFALSKSPLLAMQVPESTQLTEDASSSPELLPNDIFRSTVDEPTFEELLEQNTDSSAPAVVSTQGIDLASEATPYAFQQYPTGLSGYELSIQQEDLAFSLDPSLYDAEINWLLLRPSMSSADLSISVPTGTGGTESFLGSTDDLIDTYTSAFSVLVFTQIADNGSSVSVSGYRLDVEADAQRSFTTQTIPATLNVDYDLSIAAIKGVEYLFPLHKCFESASSSLLQNSTRLSPAHKLNFGLGVTWASVDQTYTSTLTSGSNTAMLTSKQEFEGLGLTTSLYYQLDEFEHGPLSLQPFASARGSLLTGTNRRESTFTSDPATGNPPNSVAPINVVDNREQNIPFVDFEVGSVLYATALRDDVKTDLKIRLAAVGQVWGGVGLISAADTGPSPYRDNNLFLYGIALSVEVAN